MARHSNQKLAAQFFGPYKILEHIGPVAYKFDLPAGSCLHPAFHVLLLKKCVGTRVPIQPNLPAFSKDGTIDLIPAEILDHRRVKQGRKIVHEVLIGWANLPRDDATWEDTKLLQRRFPEFDLGGKVSLEGGRSDSNLTQHHDMG